MKQLFDAAERGKREPQTPGQALRCSKCPHRRGRGCAKKETARPWIVRICASPVVAYGECNEHGGRRIDQK